ncbi:hypothetical protein KUTeg_012131 [Tegillarca granosa]|uniref:G-protein coupled receptors family 1 profile domain-containing protein n=1 Tax=Tegillarca granosa TaxID=220873 RepID=A0ABQ9EYM9_TEGGR|nr:hypothetical protein KUTeg_012131 [Tegillarca granosa]
MLCLMIVKVHIISKNRVKKFNSSMQKYNISDLNDSFKSINSSTNKAFVYEPTYNSADVSTSDSLCSGGFCDSAFGFNGTTDSGRNFSNSTMDENYNWVVLMLSPLIVFGVGGNTLVCMAISMEKRLQSVTNYFLLSLAITDLLVCVIVMPFSIIHEFVVLVWVIALAISSPITILGIIDERNVLNENQCTLRNDDFIIYGSISAFFIPLVIMIISYSLTLYLLIGQSKLNHSGQQEGQPMIRRSLSRKPIRPRTRVKFPTRRTRSCPLGEHKNAIYSPMSTGHHQTFGADKVEQVHYGD